MPNRTIDSCIREIGRHMSTSLTDKCGGVPPLYWSATGLPSGLRASGFSG